MRNWLVAHVNKREPALVVTISKINSSKNEPALIVGWTAASSYHDRCCYSGIGEFSVYGRSGYRRHGVKEKRLLSLINEAKRLKGLGNFSRASLHSTLQVENYARDVCSE